ncbi:MAG: PAS domain-containing sensor histidine kinase [Cyclobacteriaceae bacterium]|nr:PAS domain-containing sensor histidine kinase [Cyclobacteriaceae bacterium]
MIEALIVTDSNGRVLFFNEAARTLSKDILEKPIQEGDDFIRLVSPDRKEIVREIIQTIKLSKQAEKSVAQYTNLQGTTLHLECNYVPLTDVHNEVAFIHTFIRDITPQKIFEMKLTTQSANIGNLIDKANAIIIGVDTSGYITEWNLYCSKVTGFEKDEVYAQKFSDILLTKEELYFDDLLNKVLLNESVINYEMPVRTKSKKKAIFLLNGTHRTTPTLEVTGVLFVGQDITELSHYRASLEKKVQERTKELQQALRKEKEVVEMKTRFVSIASHEFRTPLSSIEYAVNAIRNPTQAGDENERAIRLSSIDKQIKHMMALLDDVLTYDKSEAGKIQLIITDISLTEFLNTVIEDVCHNTKDTHKINYEVEQLPEKIATDEKLLRNVLINLLTNAIKFSPGKPEIHLTVTNEGNQLQMTIRDEGIGIPENELNRIFEAFVRGKNTAAIQGTGLGLSIVKKAIELLGGQIQVKSQLNKGTIFTVTIPYHE